MSALFSVVVEWLAFFIREQSDAFLGREARESPNTARGLAGEDALVLMGRK